MRLILLAAAIALIAGDVGVVCCGVAVHLSLVSRTLNYMPEAVNRDVGYSQTGAFFPDAFYSCMGLSEAAEDSHWPPFLKIAVEYWREKYHNSHQGVRDNKFSTWLKNPFRAAQNVLRKDEKSSGDQLKAFIYGILTHQVADVSWHSLGVKQGLLIMLARMEFDNDIDRAHSVLDTGGDMIFLKRLLNSGYDLGWFNKGKLAWNYPTSDIIEIYRRAGYSVSSSSLDYCMIRGKAALETEFRIAKPGFVGFANQSPLLLEALEDYFLGGMLEMTMAIRHCIDGLDRWFEVGSDEDPWDLCQVFDHKRPTISQEAYTIFLSNDEEYVKIQRTLLDVRASWEDRPVKLTTRNDGPTILTTGMTQGLFGKSLAFGNFLDGLPSIAFSAPFESADDGSPKGSVYIMALSELLDEGESSKRQRRMKQIRSESPSVYEFNERYGEKLATVEIAGEDILVVSRPGISKLDFYYQGIPIAHIDFGPVQTEYGELGRKLVGEELLVADVDGDGIQDLVVGSPRSDVDGISQEGEVFIIYGSTLTEFLKKSITGGTKNAVHLADRLRVNVIHLPSHDREPNVGYSLFGRRLSMAGSTLLIGAPGRGKVYGFTHGGKKLAFELQPDADINSYTGFGNDIVASTDNWIVVSNSHENVEYSSMKQCMQCGVIYMFRISDDGRVYRQAKLSPPDGRSFDRFGQNGVLISNSTLYITSPFANNDRGVIWRVDLSRIIDDTTVDQIISQGPPPYSSGFGSAINGVQLPNNQTLVAIGMPYYGSTYNSLLEGAVAVYLL
ncbi:hypothetical protein TRICI_003677 [Trichomonascus ciferrii]|uniref:Phosphatidylinositol-glycan-specific phospholipase D n=1 Tax=Trichomonascus ciferrii TaxID=44093 RepID=A0A642V889_9ASCO|nr:hypothetical protein TRICI_003677 [Trichomonascus ciferrii]